MLLDYLRRFVDLEAVNGLLGGSIQLICVRFEIVLRCVQEVNISIPPVACPGLQGCLVGLNLYHMLEIAIDS